mmetsp:Transcript_36997/g.97967  ORF Transcript_36997/g.97967 Transcript_36997/m.97967 type:complete len:146 (-) Transcript_36997:1084-1521(-)
MTDAGEHESTVVYRNAGHDEEMAWLAWPPLLTTIFDALCTRSSGASTLLLPTLANILQESTLRMTTNPLDLGTAAMFQKLPGVLRLLLRAELEGRVGFLDRTALRHAIECLLKLCADSAVASLPDAAVKPAMVTMPLTTALRMLE